MRRPMPSAALALVVAAVLLPGSAAQAHQGNPNFRSVITGVTPKAPGVRLQILSGDDRLELTNTSSEPVVAYGYSKEQYVRILPDGTVQVNRLSPAGYVNSERYGGGTVPAFADAKAAPQWRTIDKTGRYEWHDHRIHYMAKGTPPQVKDKGAKTKVFDWSVPIAVGDRKGSITGELFWQPQKEGGPPAGAIAGFAVLLLAGATAVVLTRRRRGAQPAVDGEADATAAPARAAAGDGDGEAW